MEKKVVLKEMEPKERGAYIWDYYKWYIIGGIFAVITIVYFIVHYATLKQTVATVLMVNADTSVTTEDDSVLFEDFLTDNGCNTKKQKIAVNDGMSVNPELTDSNTFYTYQSVQTIMTAHGADVFLCDEELYEILADVGQMQDVSTVLSEDIIEKYKEDLYYTTDEETGDTYACGIVLSDNKWVEDTKLYPKGCIIGVVNGSSHPEMADKLICHILGED